MIKSWSIQTAILDVNVPPDIKIERTSKDFQTKIGATVNLDCHAEGYPDPNISWLREDKKLMRVQLPTGEVKKCKMTLFFLKNGPNPASFCLFSFFPHDKYSTDTRNDTSVDSNPGRQDGRYRCFHRAMAILKGSSDPGFSYLLIWITVYRNFAQ